MHVRTFEASLLMRTSEDGAAWALLDVGTGAESAKLGACGGPAGQRSTERPRITVLGAGVIGLSTAVVGNPGCAHQRCNLACSD